MADRSTKIAVGSAGGAGVTVIAAGEMLRRYLESQERVAEIAARAENLKNLALDKAEQCGGLQTALDFANAHIETLKGIVDTCGH